MAQLVSAPAYGVLDYLFARGRVRVIPAGKGLTSWLSFVVSTVSLSLSHWYPGSGVVLDCIDS